MRVAVKILSAAGLALAVLCTVWLQWIPLPTGLEGPPLSRLTTVYVDCHGSRIAELAGEEARSHEPIRLEEMGPWIPQFTVAKEDHRFYRHYGFDIRSVGGALLRGRGGASTITQQLVKLATRRSRVTYGTKVYEALVSTQLEWRWGKARILEEYLNRISYGNRLIGIEAATRAYFGKTARNLTRDEAVYLIGIPQAPSRFNPWRHAEAAEAQFRRSTETVRLRGGLEAEERLVLPRVEMHLPPNLAPHFIEADMASRAEVAGRDGRPGGRRGGLMECTLDLPMQRRIEHLARRHLERLNRPDIEQAAFVVLDNRTAAVCALGSVSRGRTGSEEINGALGFRNCGSTLKPFLYLAALERRLITAATVLPDTADAVREVYPDYDPHNFVHAHVGPVRVREALASSLNVPAVVTLGLVGARSVYDACLGWGLRFDRPLSQSGAGFILGTVSVRLLDLTAAYAGLAGKGVAARPCFTPRDGPDLRRVADPDAVAIVNDILCDNEARAPGFGWRSPLAVPGRFPVKTGTSAGYRDAWTVGFSQDHTIGVWVGNFDGRPMTRASSIVAAAPLWRSIVEELFAQDPGVPPPGWQRTRVCTLSGLAPCAHSSKTLGEFFLPGTEPTKSAAGWYDQNGGIVLPPEYAAWCASADNVRGARVEENADELRILAPRQEAVYVVDRLLPARQQQLEFRANHRGNTTWRLNRQTLEPNAEGRIFWQLEEGDWTVEVAEGDARRVHRFHVRRQE